MAQIPQPRKSCICRLGDCTLNVELKYRLRRCRPSLRQPYPPLIAHSLPRLPYCASWIETVFNFDQTAFTLSRYDQLREVAYGLAKSVRAAYQKNHHSNWSRS